MTADIDYLILEHLKAIRADQGVMKADLIDIKTRLLAIEGHPSAAHLDSYRQNSRLDELDTRLARVEARLDLAE